MAWEWPMDDDPYYRSHRHVCAGGCGTCSPLCDCDEPTIETWCWNCGRGD